MTNYSPTKSDIVIINFLKAARPGKSVGVTIPYMLKNPKINYTRSTLVRRLDILVAQGVVSKSYGKGRGFVYKVRSDSDIDIPRTVPEPVVKPARGYSIKETEIPPGSLDSFAEKWSQAKWEPNIFKSARYLPLSLSRLYELAAETAYGSTISPEQLDAIKHDIAVFMKDLEAVYSIVASIQARSELWDTKRFAQHVMANNKDANHYKTIAYNIKEKN